MHAAARATHSTRPARADFSGARAVEFEQLIMTWSRKNLERVPGFAVAAHSTHWPKEVGSRFEDFGPVGRFLRQGWTRVAASGHELPLALFWGRWKETGWDVYGCKRHCGRDGEGRPGNYLVHILATRQHGISLRGRIAAWDTPFLAEYDPDYSARTDLPTVRVLFGTPESFTPPPRLRDASRILAACHQALERGERISIVADQEVTRREFLAWLAAVLPVDFVNNAAISTFEADLARKDLNLVLLDRSYSDTSRGATAVFIDLDDPAASVGLDTLSSHSLQLAETLIQAYPAQAHSDTFLTINDLLSYISAVVAVGSLRRLHDDEIQGVLTIARQGPTPLGGGRARETVMRILSSDELCAQFGHALIDLLAAEKLTLEPGLDWSYVEEAVAVGAMGSAERWLTAVRLAQHLGVGGHLGLLLLGAARRLLVDLGTLSAQRVLGAIRPSLHQLERSDFSYLAEFPDLFAQLTEEEDFALAALVSLARDGTLQSVEFRQIARNHPRMTAQILRQLMTEGVEPTTILQALFDLEPDEAARLIRELPFSFGTVADFLELPGTSNEAALGVVHALWPVRADLLGVTPRIAQFLVVDGELVRDLMRRAKRAGAARRKMTR